MKKILLALAGMTCLLALIIAQTNPCGGTYGGRRSVRCCEVGDDCSRQKPNYWKAATCDIWCCPGATTYVFNGCGTFTNTGLCCNNSEIGDCYINSPLMPACEL